MRRIGPVDTIWLNMDRPNNLMVIDSLVFLDEPVDWHRLQVVLRERLLGRFPVFRQRPAAPSVPWGMPYWEDDPEFMLDRHISRTRLPAPGDDEALRSYVEGHLGRPLDRSHPLWQATLVEGYGTGAVIFCRFHHAISDGIALTHVLMSLTDPTADDGRADTTDSSDRPVTPPRGLLAPAVRALDAARGAAGSVISDASSVVTGVSRLVSPGRVGDTLVQGWRAAGVVNKLLLGSNPVTSLGGEPGVDKTAVWSRPLPLADVKHVGRLAGATVNDVLVSALAGAIWTYLVDHDGAATDLTTMVPVNLRPLDGELPSDLGNRFALVLLKLPSGVSAPLARLAETKRRMDAIKHSPESAMAFGLIATIGRTVKDVERVLVNFFSGKAIGVTTNVAGPTAPRYLAGARIAGMLAWAPSSGRQTLTVCIVTYNDTVRVGFKVDTATVRDPEKLVGAFEAHIETLTCIARAT